MTKNKQFKRTVLCVMDGLGYCERTAGNAVVAAGMPNLTKAQNAHLSTLIRASGHEVGLDSAKDAGNSEVGHNAMGAGTTIKQGLSLLNDAFATGKLFESAVWQKISKYPKLNIITCSCSNNPGCRLLLKGIVASQLRNSNLNGINIRQSQFLQRIGNICCHLKV